MGVGEIIGIFGIITAVIIGIIQINQNNKKKNTQEEFNKIVDEKEISFPDSITPSLEKSEKIELISTKDTSLTSLKPLTGKEDNVALENIFIKPSEINSKLDKLPPYQRDLLEDSYLGQKIKMDLNFSSLNKFSDNKILICLSENNSLRNCIYAIIKIDDYPQFKILPINTIVNVEGEIESFENRTIFIKNFHFSFYNNE